MKNMGISRQFTGRIARVMALVLAVAMASASRAADVAIYKDTFTRGPGPLNGTAPETRPEGSSETWSAETSIVLDGSNVTFSATSGDRAYLPVTLSAGKKYYLQATITSTPGNTGNWLAIGFSTYGSTYIENLSDLRSWAFATDKGTGTNDVASFVRDFEAYDVTGYPKPVTLRIEYDGSLSKTRVLIDGVQVRDWDGRDSAANLKYVFMLTWGITGSMDDFEFGEITPIVEPTDSAGNPTFGN